MIFIELYQIIIMNDAKENLEEIQYYISYILREPNISRRLIRKIQREISDLNYMPKRYKVIIKSRDRRK